MKILVSLVGEQPTPNLIPLFEKHALEGPEEERWGGVMFLVSTDQRFQKVGRNLLKSLKQDPITAPLIPIGLDELDDFSFPENLLETVEPWSLENVRRNIRATIGKLIGTYSKDQIVLNITGGTKIMSLAACQVAAEMELEMVYVNTEQEKIIRFDGTGKYIDSPPPLKVKISIETLFRAAGREIDTAKTKDVKAIDHQRRALLLWIAQNYDGAIKECLLPVQKHIQQGLNNKEAAGKLAKCGYQFISKPPAVSPYRAPLNPTSRAGQAAASRIREAGIWTWDGQEVTVTESEWNFINGGWLENYVVVALAQDDRFDEKLGPLFPKGLILEREDMPDIDALACRNGRLALLECKLTGSRDDGGLTNILGKMRAHERLMGGLYGASIFVRASEEDRQRVETWAQEYGVTVVIGRDLPKLTDTVFNAISKG